MNNPDTEKKILTRMMYTPSELHVREAEGVESRTITGYAILFNTPSAPLWSDEEEEAREVIAPEAVTMELLDGSDIKMTMFHDRQLILARSSGGKGTLSYSIDERGVSFSFEAPRTADGDKALELVRRGDISGCSFMFATRYYDRGYVDRECIVKGCKAYTTFTVRTITGIYDFTLAADPAYPDTTCQAAQRELLAMVQSGTGYRLEQPAGNAMRQVREMRQAASMKNLK
ncbi:MAG: HK97 family phage prohead protease [Muribaculaceae bacterium]|nr:HK97 family phage prohead protease [Muribaculaceae bacterium]